MTMGTPCQVGILLIELPVAILTTEIQGAFTGTLAKGNILVLAIRTLHCVGHG